MSSEWDVKVYAAEADKWSGFASRDRTMDEPPKARVIENGIILPLRSSQDPLQSWDGGVIASDGSFVAGHVYMHGMPNRRNVVRGYEVASVRDRRESVIYAGGIRPDQFGHFVTESLSRLWWVVQNSKLPFRIAFNRTYAISKEHPNFMLLAHLGIDAERILIIDEPTRFERVIVPDQAFFLGSGEYSSVAVKAIFDTIRNSVPAGDVAKIYLTRSQLISKTAETAERNETMLEDFYRRQGFEIISPESLSVSDQISLLAGAEALASTAGTLSHLVLFCQDGVDQTILLRHPQSWFLEGQWGISQLRDAKTKVVDAIVPLLPGSHTVGVVYFAATEHWVKYVREQYGDLVHITAPEDYVLDYIRSWSELIVETPSGFLERYPEWTVAEFATSFYTAFAGRSMGDAAHTRLAARFHDRAGSKEKSLELAEVYFDSNGGTAIRPQIVVSGSKIRQPADPHRAGYAFAGWFRSARLKVPFDFSAPVTGQKTAHARWRQVR